MGEQLIIEAKGIDKSFPGVHAIDHVDFNLKKGSVHALLGENGAGKSTFIKLIGGFYTCDEGEILFEGKKVNFQTPTDSINCGIGIVHQELNLAENLTVAENIFLGRMPKKGVFSFISKEEMNRRTKEMFAEIGIQIDPQTLVEDLSIAQQQLIEIVRVLSLNAKVVIMDEPTSSLSTTEVEMLFGIIRRLKAKHISVVYISHKLEEIFEICDEITVLRDGEKVSSLAVADTNKEDLIALMVGRKVSSERIERKRPSDKILLEVKNLLNSKLDNVSFDVKKGEIFGFSGLIGSGKTEIMQALYGLDEVYRGEVLFDGKNITGKKSDYLSKAGIGYVPEDRKLRGLFLEQSVGANMSVSSIKRFTKKGLIDTKAEEAELKNQIELLKTKTPSLKQAAKNLSGGNQQKLILSRWLMLEGLQLLLIDEPTRGIDVGAKFEIYHILSSLAEQGISVIVMSSEILELQILCDRVGVMKTGKLMKILDATDCTQTEIMKYSLD